MNGPSQLGVPNKLTSKLPFAPLQHKLPHMSALVPKLIFAPFPKLIFAQVPKLIFAPFPKLIFAQVPKLIFAPFPKLIFAQVLKLSYASSST
jgi:hypothetical protein